MTGFLEEMVAAARRLLQRPGYSLAVLLTLGIGIAMSAGMFTVLNGVVLQGLPYPGGERVVTVRAYNDTQGIADDELTPAEVAALDTVPGLEHAGWYAWRGFTVLSGDRPREITINLVGDGFFPALGVRPLHGRWTNRTDVEEGRAAVVLSYAEWDRLTGRDPGIVGQPLQMSDRTVTVVGVMPPEFTYPDPRVGLWMAYDFNQLFNSPGAFLNARYIQSVARIAEGVSPEQLTAQLDAAAAGIRDQHGIPDGGWRISTMSLLDQAVGEVKPVLYGVFAVALVVLAIACANAGGLLAARLAARQRELAVMQALGATAGRVWRGVLAELLLIGAAATALAVALVFIGVGAFAELAYGTLPRARAISVDGTVLAFACAVALLCPFAITLPLGLRLRSRFSSNLQSAGKGGGSNRNVVALPVFGLALAAAALIAGGAMFYSLGAMQAVEPGFRTSGVYALQMFRGGGPDVWRDFSGRVVAELEANYDVESVAVTTAAPLSEIGNFTIDMQLPERELAEPLDIRLRRVTPNYFGILDIPLTSGRGFTDADDAAAPKAAIINQTLAERAFGDVDPIGREIALPFGSGGARVNHRVVGVAADIRNAGLRSSPDPEVAIPFRQTPWVGMTFLVYAPDAGDDLIARMQEAMWAVDPEEGVTRAYRLDDDIAAQTAQVEMFTRLLGIFATLAALLAAFGTYSVIALIQNQRTTEIGIRLALGASRARIARHILNLGLVLALIAGLFGCVVALAVLRLLASQMFGVTPADPALYAFGIAAVTLTALAASAIPAWRSARIAPVDALHYE